MSDRPALQIVSNPVIDLKERMQREVAHQEAERQQSQVRADLNHWLDKAVSVALVNATAAGVHPRWVVDALTEAAERARKRTGVRI